MNWLDKLFDWMHLRGKPLHEYGTCRGTPARRNRLTGEVQFVLWKAGEQNHAKDYWHKFGDGWEKQFKPDIEQTTNPNCPHCRGLGYDASGYACTCVKEK